MRTAALAIGLLVLVGVWTGPLLTEWRGSFTAHMLAHMGVVAVACPLIALGMSDRLHAIRFPAWLPVAASFVELIVVWTWHTPAMRALAEASIPATVLEQAVFLCAGLLLWIPSLRQSPHDIRSAGPGIFALLFTSMHMTLLGTLLALSPRPLYGLDDVTCLGLRLGAGQDQTLGGVVMLLIGGIVYLAGGLFLLRGLLNTVPQPADGSAS